MKKDYVQLGYDFWMKHEPCYSASERQAINRFAKFLQYQPEVRPTRRAAERRKAGTKKSQSKAGKSLRAAR